MSDEPRRLRRERETVRAMVALYCRRHHPGPAPCAACARLADYADRRLDRCPYGPDKPTCVNCPIHCYRPAPRERMREVMRFAGPRMLWRHPYLAIMHLLDGRREAPEKPAGLPATEPDARPRAWGRWRPRRRWRGGDGISG